MPNLSPLAYKKKVTTLHVTPRICANPSWTNVPKIHHKTSEPKIFISHIPVLNFAGTALHVTPRICANPSWTNVPQMHHNVTNDSWLSFENPSSSTSQDSPPKISMFTFFFWRQKRLHFERVGSLARRHRPIKTWLRPSLQNWFSVSFGGLSYLRPTCCKHVLKRCSLGWNPFAAWFV